MIKANRTTRYIDGELVDDNIVIKHENNGIRLSNSIIVIRYEEAKQLIERLEELIKQKTP